jgi:uncharacterized protein YggE
MRTPEPGTARLIALFVIALVAVALGASVLASTAPAQVAPAPPTPKSLTISGDAEIAAVPDVAYVGIGIQTRGQTPAEATQANSRLARAVLDALRAEGVQTPDLKTTGLSTRPLYNADSPQRPPPIVGYEAIYDLTVRAYEADRAGRLIETALAAGANRVGGLRLGARDPAALEQQALAGAGRNARAKADALAEGLGLRVVTVSNVQGDPMPARAAFPEVPVCCPALDAAPGPPPVEAGETRVTARVQVTFVFE